MSFRVKFNLEGCEFRRRRSGMGQKGEWHSLQIEDYDGNSVDVSVRDDNLWKTACQQMRKGEFYNLPCLAVATNDYSFLALDGEPERVPDPEDELDAGVDF